ncbi:uncharacterized protein LOC143554063 [Bidens hawaiensis]|uniref:uncharacterized protein LOC143554063 n=1 Tax=Bidens hawaiensis TaxID=980011 RepID=UPI00404ABF8F
MFIILKRLHDIRAYMYVGHAKNKLCFVNNTLVMPSDEQQMTVWKRCSDMVISWILNTLTQDISDSVLYAQTAKALWNELNARYGQANGAKFYKLQKNLCQITHGNNDIPTYFAKMKSNWDELNATNTLPSCTCGEAHAFAKRYASS